MTNETRKYAVNGLLIFIALILLKILISQFSNYWLTPRIGEEYGASQKMLVSNNQGGFYEVNEYTQVKVYNYTNDSVFYILTMYNGVSCYDSCSSTILQFSKFYH